MQKMIGALAGLALAMASTNAAQAQGGENRAYTAAGAWSLDYGEDYCRLARQFSNGEGTLAVAFERIQAGPFFRLILIGEGVSLYRSSRAIGYRFLPGGGDGDAMFVRSETPDGQLYLNLGAWLTLAPLEPPKPGETPAPFSRSKEQETAASVTAIAFEGGLTAPVRIETGSLKQPIAALQACADDLLASWGLDAAKHQAITEDAAPAGPMSD